MTAVLAAPARIQRRTAPQRMLLPRVRRTVNDLLCLGRMDETAARAAVEARLSSVRDGLAAAPYWRDRLRAAGSSPRDLRSLEDLAALPLLPRNDLALRWRDVVLLPEGDAGTVVVQSSGSTGQPVPVPKNAYDQVHMWAVLRYWMRALNIPLPRRPRVVLLCSLPGGLAYSVRLPLLRGGALHRISLARPGPLARLRRARPDILFTDPAGLHWLAAQDLRITPRLALSSAQHLAPSLRGRASRALAAPILDYYATTETGPIAWRCLQESETFHVLAPDVWVESVGGELAITRLRPAALPLVRYLPGDGGRVVFGACRCGVRGFQIHGFRGRHPSLFTRPDGRDVDGWQLAFLFKHADVRNFQLRQHGRDRFELALPDANEAGNLVARLGRALEALGWRGVRIDVVPMDAAPESIKPEPFVRAH